MRYYYLIDGLRCISALIVVVFHFSHFSRLAGGSVHAPFSSVLAPIYRHGLYAVPMFWVISGFVFAHVYGTKGGQIKGYRFFINRFSRLYPLHFATLIFVALLQQLSIHLCGRYQLYQHNDLFHFVLQLFFASSWGFERGTSFNGPIWSVSVEVLIYLVFFLLCKFEVLRIRNSLLLVALSLVLVALTNTLIGKCGALFFCGVIVYQFNLRQSHDRARNVRYAFATCLFFLLASSMGAYYWYDYNSIVVCLLLFPTIIWLMAATEPFLPTTKLLWLKTWGDITYATYLVHVPLQIAFLLWANLMNVRGIADHPRALWIGYLASVIIIAFITNQYFEKPARTYLRDKLL